MLRPAFLAALLLPLPATAADLIVQFVEGAPKDRFIIQADELCASGPGQVTIDLGGSAAGLIFDVTGAGAGVEVFQPLEIVDGAARLTDVPEVRDGDNSVALDFRDLSQAGTVAFTIDVDDTAGGREITVNGSEIVGAEIGLTRGGVMQRAVFDASATARLTVTDCLS